MLLRRLREHTAFLHQRVERAVDVLTCCSTVATYRNLLARMLGIYAPLEDRLSGFDWTSVGIDLAARRKSPRLQQDLHVLGMPDSAIAALPVCQSVPQPPTLAAAVGMMYVVEGATLGGQIISRHLRNTLGITSDSGASFYTCYGEQSGAMWRSFGIAAERHCGDGEQPINQALSLAVSTFEAFERWLTASPAPGECSAGRTPLTS